MKMAALDNLLLPEVLQKPCLLLSAEQKSFSKICSYWRYSWSLYSIPRCTGSSIQCRIMLSGIVKKSGDIQWKFEQICRDRNVKKLEELIQSGWNVNTKFYTSRWGSKEALPLQLAVRDQWVEGVIVLLKAGSQTWQTFEESYGDRWSRTCLMYACHLNHHELIKTLVEYGKPPDVNLRDRYQHFSPLPESLYSYRSDTDAEIIEFLLEKGADVDIIGYKKGFFVFPNSPVTISIKRGNYIALKLLINYGANLHVTPREHIQSFVKDSTAYSIPYTLGQYRRQTYSWGHGIVCFTMDLILKCLPDNSHNLVECLYILLEAGCPTVVTMHENSDRVEKIYSQVTDLKQPRSLKWQCRKFLRMDLGLFKPPHVCSLPIPKPLQRYILCRDL